MMRLCGVTGLALFSLVLPVAAESILIDDFDGPFDTPQGHMDHGPITGGVWRNIGYGPPSLYDMGLAGNLVPAPDNSENQAYEVPGTAYQTNPIGTGTLANLDSCCQTPVQTNWATWVVAQGGAVPDLGQPAWFTADVLIVADNPDDYDKLTITYDNWFDDDAGTGKLITPFDLLADPVWNGIWRVQKTLLTYDVFPASDGMPQLFFDFEIDNDSAGDVTFYVNDLRINYTAIPEPASLLLLVTGAICRRRPYRCF